MAIKTLPQMATSILEDVLIPRMRRVEPPQVHNSWPTGGSEASKSTWWMGLHGLLKMNMMFFFKHGTMMKNMYLNDDIQIFLKVYNIYIYLEWAFMLTFDFQKKEGFVPNSFLMLKWDDESPNEYASTDFGCQMGRVIWSFLVVQCILIFPKSLGT